MWDRTIQLLDDGRVQHFAVRRHGSPVSYGEVLRHWQEDEAARSFFTSLLTAAKFACYRWETPPVTKATAGRAFEFVLLNEPGLDRKPDPAAFAEQFRAASEGERVVAFPNLGHDAVLVVPRPAGPAAYAHLAAFVRGAPAEQVHDLWRIVAITMDAQLGAHPTWLSTAGVGVPWLHVRLDSRPKYYGFAAYRALT